MMLPKHGMKGGGEVKINGTVEQWVSEGMPHGRIPSIPDAHLKAVARAYPGATAIDDLDVMVRMKWNDVCAKKVLCNTPVAFKSLGDVREWFIRDAHHPDLGLSVFRADRRTYLVRHGAK